MSGTSLGTLVTYNPWSIGPTAQLDEIAARFEELNIHHVAVVDGERRVIGMVSETDLLRARQSQRCVLIGGGPADPKDAQQILAGDLMTRDVLSISTTANFHEALHLLLQRQIHALPVVDGGRLVGMVNSRDFLREFSYGDLPGTREPVSSPLLGHPPEPASPDMLLHEALLAMQETGVPCLAVAQGNCPVGVVSQRDIVRAICRLDEQPEFHQATRPDSPLLRVTRNSPPIRSGQRLCDAAAAMVDHALPAITVVNQSNRFLGLITEDDLLQVLYDAQA